MTHASEACLSQAFIDHLVAAVAVDARLKSKSFGLHLTFSLRDTETGNNLWLRMEGDRMHGGVGEADARFTLAGRTEAWRALCGGMPINRLLRQGRIEITGDARTCIQNWLVVFFITSGAVGFKG